jgi:hypothetical protein
MVVVDSKKLSKYEILEEMGRGGFATVYRALDPDLDREVALKVLDPLLTRDPVWVARFRREARAVARLDHPHVVTIYEVGQAEGMLFIATRLVEGGTLAGRIRERGPLRWDEVVRLVGEISEALDYAHDQGVIHRDLKSANVLLDGERGAQLTDFGFASIVSESSYSVSISGGVVGTPQYIAPEVWEGQTATAQTDIYALGCILYEMVVGQHLFQGDTTPSVMRAHFQPVELPEAWPEGVPPGLEEVLQAALAKDAAARCGRAGELAEAVAGLMEDRLAEPYAALEAAVAAEEWEQALKLAQKIQAEDPGYGAVVALEEAALEGLERAARAKEAATWQAEAERALAEGDLRGAERAARQWEVLTPDDPGLAALLVRLEEAQDLPDEASLREPVEPQPGSSSLPESGPVESIRVIQPPPITEEPRRRVPGWVLAVGALALVVLCVAVSMELAPLVRPAPRMMGDAGSTATAPSEPTATALARTPATAHAQSTQTTQAQATVQSKPIATALPRTTATTQVQTTTAAQAQATATALARITATAHAQTTETAQARATIQSKFLATAVARTTATAQVRAAATARVQATAQSIQAAVTTAEQVAVQVVGPLNGSLKHKPGTFPTNGPDGSWRDFVAEARFYNPYASSMVDWDYGFVFRRAEGDFYVIYVRSNSTWRYSAYIDGEWISIDTGKSSSIRQGADESNTLRLIVADRQGYLYANDSFVTMLDTSSLTSPGLVLVATGIMLGDDNEGETTRYEDFVIHDLKSSDSNGSTNSATISPKTTAHEWSWRGHGPYDLNKGVFGFENYTNEVLTLSISGVGDFQVPEEAGSVLAVPLLPGTYTIHAKIPTGPSILIRSQGGVTTHEVQAGRAWVVSVVGRVHPDGYYIYNTWPWYEEPDQP